jgi:uncharacterized protein (DUF58 family)
MPEALVNTAAEPSDALLRRLEWTVLKRLDGLLQGDLRSFARGSGLDLADLREYQPHDDVRHIDWNVTARLQTPHVRQFNEDRDLCSWLLIDLSASMDFGSGARSKRQLARELVGALGSLLTRHGNRVGAVIYGQGATRVLPAQSGRGQVLRLLHAMAPPSAAATAQATDLADLLRVAGGVLRRRAAVFLISDFVSAPGWARRLGPLALRHDVTAVRLLDPLEMALPNLGGLPMRDAETGETLWVDTGSAGFRARYAAAAERHENALRAALAHAGVDTLELSTDDDLLRALLRAAELRRQRSRCNSATPRGPSRALPAPHAAAAFASAAATTLPAPAP